MATFQFSCCSRRKKNEEYIEYFVVALKFVILILLLESWNYNIVNIIIKLIAWLIFSEAEDVKIQ